MSNKSDKQLAVDRLERSLHQLQLAIQTRELSYGAAPLVLASEHLLKEAIRIQTDG